MPRAATVIASTPSDMMILNKETYDRVIKVRLKFTQILSEFVILLNRWNYRILQTPHSFPTPSSLNPF